jgi:catechol 2,3-dioxygenase-like lactoylglutathione lyase family enzyme
LNVNPRAEIKKIAVMSASSINLEIFDYADNIHRSKTAPNNADIGGHHMAFNVDDMDSAVAYLKEQGIEVLGSPNVMTDGPTAGESWVYFMSPWGMQLELVSYPNGKAYEHSSSLSLFDPR